MKCSTELIDKKHVLQAYMYNIECSETVLPVRHLRTAVVMVCTYSSETGAKDELPYYHTIRPKFVVRTVVVVPHTIKGRLIF